MAKKRHHSLDRRNAGGIAFLLLPKEKLKEPILRLSDGIIVSLLLNVG